MNAAGRILDGIPRRIAQLADLTQVHSYFAADPMIGKLHTLIADLRTLGAAVPADELDTRLKTARDQALRAVRDKRELVSEGGDTLRLGRHAFTVHRQPVDLTLVAREEGMAYQVTGTDYQSPVDDERLQPLQRYWNQSLVSEAPALSRAEYLAGRLLEALLEGKAERSWADVRTLLAEDPQHPQLLEMVRRFAAARYQEGYQKGIHDDDALRLLGALVAMQDQAGLLAWGPTERALALLYWQHGHLIAHRESLLRRARAAMQMHDLFGRRDALDQLEADTARSLNHFARDVLPDLLPLADTADEEARDAHKGRIATLCDQAAAYLVRELAAHNGETWAVSGAGEDWPPRCCASWSAAAGAKPGRPTSTPRRPPSAGAWRAIGWAPTPSTRRRSRSTGWTTRPVCWPCHCSARASTWRSTARSTACAASTRAWPRAA